VTFKILVFGMGRLLMMMSGSSSFLSAYLVKLIEPEREQMTRKVAAWVHSCNPKDTG
jgi:hypothetical protein